MDSGWVIYLIPIVAILGGFAVAITGIVTHARLRELKIRERIAMIEKGLVPPPEVDPAGFDRAMSGSEWYAHRRAGRSRRAGIILVGVGLGLIVLKYADASGSIREGIGPGGFVAILGLAFLVSSFFDRTHDRGASRSSRTPPAPPPAE